MCDEDIWGRADLAGAGVRRPRCMHVRGSTAHAPWTKGMHSSSPASGRGAEDRSARLSAWPKQWDGALLAVEPSVAGNRQELHEALAERDLLEQGARPIQPVRRRGGAAAPPRRRT